MPKQPMAEVFGFRIDDLTDKADRHRQHRLCPFNNKVPSCTKDKANDPLGVCSIYDGNNIAITCPVRFRQDWLIATDAAAFFFPPGTKWTSLTEIRLYDRHGKSVGNIDVVLVSYDEEGKIIDFGALEVQSVYISGNIRKPFIEYKRDILNAWGRKMAVAVDNAFFATLPTLSEVPKEQANVAWFVYDLQHNVNVNRYQLILVQTIYTQFKPTLQIANSLVSEAEYDFYEMLQCKLDEQLD